MPCVELMLQARAIIGRQNVHEANYRGETERRVQKPPVHLNAPIAYLLHRLQGSLAREPLP